MSLLSETCISVQGTSFTVQLKIETSLSSTAAKTITFLPLWDLDSPHSSKSAPEFANQSLLYPCHDHVFIQV
jgi:hypothetical protein